MSAIVMVFLLGAFYLLGGTLLTLAARAFGWSGPGFENAVLALSLPYLAAVWWSHALVMDRIDKLG